MKRREFLEKTLCATCSSALFGSMLPKLALAQSAAGGGRRLLGNDYRALVGVYLYGGNDAFNMIVPRDASHYATYAATRTNLAVPQAQLLALNPLAGGLPSDGAQYGLHPNMAGMQGLFNSGRAAIIGNVGPLVRPVTKAEYQAGTAILPPQLYSHSDQTVFWQTPRADTDQRLGWGGKLADIFFAQNPNPNLSMNISLDGENVFQAGEQISPYFMSPDGVEQIGPLVGDWDYPIRRRNTFNALMAASLGHPLQRAYRDVVQRTRAVAAEVEAALDASIAATPNTAPPYNAFPDTWIGRQLRMVARMISIRDVLQMNRQIFMVGVGGYDNHDNQLADHPALLLELSQAVTAFYNATAFFAIQNSVTTFTMSEFGRTLTNNGDGTDHGWGGHAFVVGGAVNGQRFYGHMPNLADSNNDDDADWGQIIPRVSVDQYAATISKWYGLSDLDRPTIFPNLQYFPSYGGPDLGFMQPPPP
jgi:uncharacterized protein (DUF1501 family)